MWQEDQVPTRWVLFYETKWGDIKYANLFFTDEKSAYDFSHNIPDCSRAIAITEDEFREYCQLRYEGLSAEQSWWNGRQKRPIDTHITEIIPEDEYQDSGYQQRVTIISDERARILERPFRNYTNYRPEYIRPNFASLPFSRKK